jgi:GDP-L-fucose synthase
MPAPPGFSLHGRRVFVAGHCGMVGQALIRRLANRPLCLLTARRDELDLTDQAMVERWMQAVRPQMVIIAAAKVGGILANASFPVDFLEQNLLIELNLIRASFRIGVEKLLFLGSSCIYPRDCRQPIRENELLAGPLESTNEWYAIAKIAGIALCRAYRTQHGADFISAMPTNLYGPGDNFDPTGSHVVPGLLRRLHEATLRGDHEVDVWGSGKARREFLHVDDAAEALLVLLDRYSGASHVNVGSGSDLAVSELARLIAKVVGFKGRLRFDTSRPDGTPRKLLDVSRMTELGWRPRIGLEEGLRETYAWFLEHQACAVDQAWQGRAVTHHSIGELLS